jgi:hypothetical protein
LTALLTAIALLAADVTVKVDAPVGTTVTITVTVPPSTNVNKLLTRHAIPMPPMPPMVRLSPKRIPVFVPQIKPLPNGTNRTYSEHLDSLADFAMKRRNE